MNELRGSEWWSGHRRRYNVRLLIAASLIFAAQVSFLLIKTDLTVFTTTYMVVSYLITVGIANVCYYLGPIAEKMLKPRNVTTYRKVTYNLSFSFFVFIMFVSPLVVGYLIVISGSTSR